MLQRMCEDVEYIELLSLAARCGAKDEIPKKHPAIHAAAQKQWKLDQLHQLQKEEASLMRLMLVAAFAMSNYSSTVGRTSKPFNPMLGETYELVDGMILSIFSVCRGKAVPLRQRAGVPPSTHQRLPL